MISIILSPGSSEPQLQRWCTRFTMATSNRQEFKSSWPHLHWLSQLHLNMVWISQHHISGQLWMQFLHHRGANPLSCLQTSLRTCQKVDSGSNFQLDLTNRATQIKDFNAEESKRILQFLSGKLCSQEGIQSELSLLKTWKRVRTSSPTHNALWLTHSPTAAHACLFSLELTCYPDRMCVWVRELWNVREFPSCILTLPGLWICHTNSQKIAMS